MRVFVVFHQPRCIVDIMSQITPEPLTHTALQVLVLIHYLIIRLCIHICYCTFNKNKWTGKYRRGVYNLNYSFYFSVSQRFSIRMHEPTVVIRTVGNNWNCRKQKGLSSSACSSVVNSHSPSVGNQAEQSTAVQFDLNFPWSVRYVLTF